ncbi:MAG: Asp-tRNA(Asn)/Glu-tRNA(Gln) amidotransferase subunit GatC [Alphaproteobacteria bacterium]|nr:Asp-tRNA(Asn)/Glu-tRNA(Gln) amidotransferase subunit GatC [Alphaproteobacteria bacterium]
MSLDEATVARIARLARIRIEPERRAALAGELSHILDWIEQLNEVDTDDVPPMTSVGEAKLALRADEVVDGDKVEKILANAPEQQDGHFVVPKVVE